MGGHYDPIHCFRGANKIPRVHVIEALLLTGHMINGASTFGRENSFTFYKQQQRARQIGALWYSCALCMKRCPQETLHSLPLRHLVMLSAKRCWNSSTWFPLCWYYEGTFWYYTALLCTISHANIDKIPRGLLGSLGKNVL